MRSYDRIQFRSPAEPSRTIVELQSITGAFEALRSKLFFAQTLRGG